MLRPSVNMDKLCLLLVFFCVISSSHCAEEGESAVLDLTADTFNDAITNNPVILVEFFAPWCGHCQRLAPEYEEAAVKLSAHEPPVALAKVDATEESSLANRFGVDGYPTLKVFHSGTAYDYEGPRTAQGIVDYMIREARPDWEPPKDQVLVLTSQNFTDVVESTKLMLVEFYAPWCGHCKRLAPEFSKAAKDLKGHGITLAKVDATEEKELAEQYGVSGYPTLKLMRWGKDYDYNGQRQRYGIVQYMLEQAQPASREITSKKDMDIFMKNQVDPVFMTLASSSSADVYNNHDNLANMGRESPLTFVHTFSSEVVSSLGIGTDTSAILTPERFQSDYEAAVRKWEGDLSADNVTALLESVVESSRPLVGVRTKSNVNWYHDYPILVVYTEVDWSSKNIDILRGQLLPLAHEFSGHLSVAISDEEEFADELKSLGFDDWGEDVAIAIWASSREKYRMSEDFDVDSLREFIADYQSGSLKPHLRTQPRPKQHGPITVVVGSTFEDIVLDTSKHVLIEFYAPWCGHCKALEPKYKKLAKQFKNEDSVVIAKFDATANDSPPQFEFSGFPTIFFVGAGDNSVQVYQGQREAKDMSKFVRKEAKLTKKKTKEEL